MKKVKKRYVVAGVALLVWLLMHRNTEKPTAKIIKGSLKNMDSFFVDDFVVEENEELKEENNEVPPVLEKKEPCDCKENEKKAEKAPVNKSTAVASSGMSVNDGVSVVTTDKVPEAVATPVVPSSSGITTDTVVSTGEAVLNKLGQINERLIEDRTLEHVGGPGFISTASGSLN